MTARFFVHEILPEALLLAAILLVLWREIRRQRRDQARTHAYRSRLVYRDARVKQDIWWREELARAKRLEEASGLAEKEFADVLGIDTTDRETRLRSVVAATEKIERGNALLAETLGLRIVKGGVTEGSL